MHKYEYTTADGSRRAMTTIAKYREAMRIAKTMAAQRGQTVVNFEQVY